MGLTQDIADRLLQIKAVKLNVQEPFTWASGLRSPIYCDNRKILSYPEIRNEIVSAFVEKAKLFAEAGAIAGVATAGIAWGALLADRLGLPFVYVRAKPKEHGLKNLLEGEISTGTKVLVIEDLVSTGGSSIEAIQALELNGNPVLGLIAIFQYGFQSAQAKFLEKNISFHTLSDFNTLLEQALHQKYINNTDSENLSKWNGDPKLWSDNFLLKKANL
ncbi:MAG: orotate phosphoribosyltransferase [Saprospiraceae bacterium]